jgi:hypothetical protein
MREVSCVGESVIAGIEIHVELDTELDGTARLRSLFLTILERSYDCVHGREVFVCVCVCV